MLQQPGDGSAWKGMMPAKSISWTWEPGGTNTTAPLAKVFYNGVQLGMIRRDMQTGEYNGYIQLQMRPLDASEPVLLAVEVSDGYASIGDVGKQLGRKLVVKARTAGFQWPW